MTVLTDYFSSILAETGSRGPVGELVSLLSQGTLDRGAFSEIISRHGVARESWFRKQRLDLVLGYVIARLDSGPMHNDDVASVSSLKKCLGITEGEFISLRPAEVAALLAGQLNRILEDDIIDEREDLYQLDLQAAFDLSYDQYLQLTRAEFERAMASLSERAEYARSAGNQTLARELDLKIAALQPVYQLSLSQPRTLGALY